MVTLEQLYEPISRELKVYREKFEAALQHEDDLLGQVLGHVRRRNGKMMRPVLVLLVAREFGTVGEAAYRSAITLELLHTASLLHDDVVDESNERRGQSSVNAVYDNKIAVLVGDYILSTSLEQATLTDSMRIVRRISSLGKLLSDGEVKQIANIKNRAISEQSYYDVIRHKTAELFAACAELGAVSSQADESGISDAHRLGEIIGMCFQIRDDIFDYFEGSEIGKPTGNDMREGKLTLPAIHVLKTTGDKRMLDIAAKVKDGTVSHDEIGEFVDFTKKNGGIEYAEQVMDRFRNEAREIVSRYSNKAVRDALMAYIDFVVERKM